MHGKRWNETAGSAVFKQAPTLVAQPGAAQIGNSRESEMTSQTQIHTIARQMFERHGNAAIAQAASNALACERKGETEEATEWRHIEDAMKMMRGPHQS
jgi:hypothetical protein